MQSNILSRLSVAVKVSINEYLTSIISLKVLTNGSKNIIFNLCLVNYTEKIQPC